MIKGITVTLYNRTQTGIDEFNRPIYDETPEEVKNVLVGEPSTEDIIDALRLTGKRTVYTLAIPKGDEHVWEDRRVDFFGQSWHTFGRVIQGIEENIPLLWNKKVQVEQLTLD